MSFKIIMAAIVGLMLILLPVAMVQNVEAAQYRGAGEVSDIFGADDPMAMLGGIWEFITQQGPQLIGQIFQVLMAVLFSVMAFLQTIIAMAINPQGIPLLLAMAMNGLNYAFSYGLTFMMYGGIIGLIIPLPIISAVPGLVIGAVVGIVFGFVYGFVYGSEAEMPDKLVNPFTEGWPESIFPA